jgi:uncharacterized protein YcnI
MSALPHQDVPRQLSSSAPSVGRAWRLGASLVGAAALVLLPVAAASAHVRVIPDATSSDGFAKVTFRVPNESDSAGTVKVEVALPTDAPFSSVTYLPVPGWTAEVVTATLPAPVDVKGATLTEAPARVVWTADAGTQIAPGAFEEFSIVAGPLPDPGKSVVLPATQTYSDGEVVKWDQVVAEGAAEPELPAPVLVVPGGEEAAASAPAATHLVATDPAASADTAGVTTSDPLARWLGGLGLLLGAGGLVFALTRRATRTR